MTRRPDPFDHLADALAEDILAAPAERMLAEAAEDHGDRAALAAAFDSVATRAARRSRPRPANRVAVLAAMLAPKGSWRPAMAAVAGLAVIAVAGDLYWHVRPAAPPAAASRPAAAPPAVAKGSLAHDRAAIEPAPPPAPGRRADAMSRTVQPAPAPGAPPADAPRRVKTVVIGGGSAPVNIAQAPLMVRPPVSDDRILTLLEHTLARRGVSQPAPPSAVASTSAPRPAAPGLFAPLSNPAPPSFDWPLRGRVLARFGPAGGAARNDGIDLAVPTGTDVRAAADGVVLYAGSAEKGFGNLVLVSHAGGFVTVYGYASRILVKATDQVRRGQVIAKSGASGEAPQPALHFEIRKDAAPVDPAQYLPPG